MRLRPNSPFYGITGVRRSGYTLVEILVATTLTLILMTAVVSVFAGVGDGISKARRAMEQFDRLRTTAQQLRLDLQGLTVKLDGRPIRPEENQGYFEYIEGSILPSPQAVNSVTTAADWTVGGGTADSNHARGDILMFTTRNAIRPFLGRYALSVDSSNPTLQSDVAEVSWFLRGNTLHRRFLLVVPGVNQNSGFAGQSKSTFYQSNDISTRVASGQLVANSLGDLTKRENRFAHPVNAFPFDVRAWGLLGLPTLAECSSPSWMSGWVNGTTPTPGAGPNFTQIDLWNNTSVASTFGVPVGTSPDQYMCQTKQDATRLADDVILTNVIGFDVKVWEPAANNGAGGYVDLGYNANPPVPGGGSPIQLKSYTFPLGPTVPRFQHPGIYALSTQYGLVATAQNPQRVYDSGCFSYENEGIYHFDQSGKVVQPPDVPGGTSTNGLDDDGNGVVDDLGERINSAPYPVPLRGIQVTIRCFEPDSRQIRQITIEQDFLPK